MSISAAGARNEKEIAYWNGPGGANWVSRQQSQDAILAPILDAILAAAAVRAGERVLDVGCGTGASTIELARRAGPSGRVLAVDVSAGMLARAAERLAMNPNAEFVQADASTYRFPQAHFDLLFSRFGVMFFADPTGAFANMRAALKPGGRLAFCCWRTPDENPWLMMALRAAYEHVPPLPRPGPEDPGPFSFASEERVRRILDGAGFQKINLKPVDLELDIATGGGLDEAVKTGIDIGPVSRAIDGQPAAVCDKVAASIREALRPHLRGARVLLAAAIWIVTAASA